MKIAIVHDWLNQKDGGAESVLFELATIYPEADIFTLVYNSKLFDSKLKKRKIITSRLSSFPSFMRRHPQLLLPFIKKAVEKWDFSSYDLVISSSTAWVKNINITGQTKHICYCHSPARMLWDSWPEYLTKFKLGPVRRYCIMQLVSRLRLWDYYKSQNNTQFIANSKYVAKRIAKFYHQPSDVIYPPVKLMQPLAHTQKDNYYLIISVLAEYKNIDLAVRAFIANGKRLIIAGSGPDLARLKELAIANDNIKFVGQVDESQKEELYQKARAFIFCSIEDFGITMVESISAGTPVLALNGGGAQEIITPGKTGIFFDEPNEESLNRCIVEFENDPQLNIKTDKNAVVGFEKKNFIQQIKKKVENASK